MKTQEELEREINERAAALLGGQNNSYEEFKKIKEENKIVKDNSGNIAKKIEPEMNHDTQKGAKDINFNEFKSNSDKHQNTIPQKSNQVVKKYYGYGGFWARFAASIITQIFAVTIIGILSGILFVIINPGTKVAFTIQNTQDLGLFIVAWFPIVFLLGYGLNIYWYFKDGQGVGYKALGLKVIDKNSGEKPTTGALLGRWAIKALLTYTPYLNSIGYLVTGGMIAWSDKKQGPHDHAANTIVVAEKKMGAILWIIVGLTIIIPIIVIAIIMFIALKQIDPGKQKNATDDALIMSQMTQLPTEAILANPEDFTNTCADLSTSIENIKVNENIEFVENCISTKTDFVFGIRTRDGKDFCVDTSGLHEGFQANTSQVKCEESNVKF